MLVSGAVMIVVAVGALAAVALAALALAVYGLWHDIRSREAWWIARGRWG